MPISWIQNTHFCYMHFVKQMSKVVCVRNSCGSFISIIPVGCSDCIVVSVWGIQITCETLVWKVASCLNGLSGCTRLLCWNHNAIVIIICGTIAISRAQTRGQMFTQWWSFANCISFFLYSLNDSSNLCSANGQTLMFVLICLIYKYLNTCFKQ